MPTLAQGGKVTLLDIAKATDPDGRIADVAEMLTQTNEILLDLPWFEGNLPTGHKATIRTGLPTSVWREFYQGVPPSKSVRAQITDACAMLETRSEVDADEANLNGNMSAFRMSEAKAFVESMNQTMADSFFYGNTAVNPERFNGLTPRYSSLSAASGTNILNAGGTTGLTSVWLVVMGKETIHGIYPRGSLAGLQHQDLGMIDAFDSNQNRFRAYADWWQWKCGLHVKDWRYAVRIANIDTAALIAGTGTQASTASTQLIKLMIRALARIPYASMGNAAFYANRTIKELLGVQALDRSQNALGITDAARQFGGVQVAVKELNFFGTPVRTVDRLLNTEAVVA